MKLWYVRQWIIENGEEVVLDSGPWERHLAEIVLADIGHDATAQHGPGRVKVVRAILVPVEEDQDPDDVLVEPRYTTGGGARGEIMGWGRGPFTERDENRTIFFCLMIPRRELG